MGSHVRHKQILTLHSQVWNVSLMRSLTPLRTHSIGSSFILRLVLRTSHMIHERVSIVWSPRHVMLRTPLRLTSPWVPTSLSTLLMILLITLIMTLIALSEVHDPRVGRRVHRS